MIIERIERGHLCLYAAFSASESKNDKLLRERERDRQKLSDLCCTKVHGRALGGHSSLESFSHPRIFGK